MIDAIEHNLKSGIELLGSISEQQYRDTSVKPYHSSIGGHMRHILDIFDCVFCGLDRGHVDLTARTRNQLVERSPAMGIAYFETTLEKLRGLEGADMEQLIDVSDDLGLGMVTAKYTLAAALIQAHSHAMHHFASLGYIVTNLGIDLPTDSFGFNPTTPREVA
ncbi:MAG: hypothetical protein JKY25_11770 [Robiginitomaculum sp.]|nr:hypothetical protein [Robiginitomaculum sp.]